MTPKTQSHYFGSDTPLKYALNRDTFRYTCGYCGHETKTENGQKLHTQRMIEKERNQTMTPKTQTQDIFQVKNALARLARWVGKYVADEHHNWELAQKDLMHAQTFLTPTIEELRIEDALLEALRKIATNVHLEKCDPARCICKRLIADKAIAKAEGKS